MAKRKFALDLYMSRMFKTIMYFIPFLALFAGISFTILKSVGFYEGVSWPLLVSFDSTTVIYCILGIFFATHCQDENKNLKRSYINAGKVVISLVILIQWNFISYMIPSRTFWAFFSLFIFVSVFFLDRKYVLHNIAVVITSMIISWIINGDNLLPSRSDPNYIPDIVLICILTVLVSLLMYLITLIVEKLLVEELESIAEYDSLTLLRNRRTLPMKMDEAIENFEKNNVKFCFMMCDIDDFKVVNDTHGHPFGDIVLKDIAKTFVAQVGPSDNVFRYGGEEICCFLFMDLEEGLKTAEHLRQSIEKEVHVQGNVKASVTMSMGIMEYKSGMSKEDVIKVADSNLYYAKSHGKNKVIN